MLSGHWRDQKLGSGSDVWKFWAEKRAGNITDAQWSEIEDGIARSPGHCMTMGTASTMTSAAEAMGFTLPGAASIPAADSRHGRMATETGRRIVEMVWEDLKPRDFLDAASIDNAVTTVLSLGGSTNSVVHMVAVARRAGIPLTIDRFDAIARKTPLIANLRPAGKFLMEDFFYAGGLRALLNEIGDLLTLSARTVNGKTLGENIAGAEVFNRDVILPRDKALVASDSLAVLRGNLAPDGAVIKPAAAEPHLLRHTGPAVVFADYNDMAARIDDPALPVTKDSVLVLQHAGPLGAPGMPEWGQLPIPKKLLAQGVRDMVRISDARMSGTSYGACVLHVAPESFVGGPLALVRDGDLIELDVPARKLELKVGAEELARRRAAWTAARAQIRARLRSAVPAAHHAGRPGLRLRFPRGNRGDDRTGNTLMKTIAANKLTNLVAAIMQGGGCAAGEARTVAQRLVDSNLVGHDSHGVLRVGKYLEWVGMGWLKPNTDPTIVFDSPALVIVDGNRGFGQVIGEFATRLGIAKAAKSGIAMVGLRNCGHLGRLGDWAEMAAEQGQVSLHFLNTSGAQRVAPFGGSDRRLSTNPLAIGVPCAERPAGHSRHHDVDGGRGQADGRVEQGRAGSRRVDRRQARQADDGSEGFLRWRRAVDDRRAQGFGPVDTHRPPRRRDHDGTQFRSRRHGTAQQHAVDLHRARGLRRHRWCAG